MAMQFFVGPLRNAMNSLYYDLHSSHNRVSAREHWKVMKANCLRDYKLSSIHYQ